MTIESLLVIGTLLSGTRLSAAPLPPRFPTFVTWTQTRGEDVSKIHSTASLAIPQRTKTRRKVHTIVGAVGGFLIGSHYGQVAEQDSCKCDTVGMKGFVIGGSIGALVGGILGRYW